MAMKNRQTDCQLYAFTKINQSDLTEGIYRKKYQGGLKIRNELSVQDDHPVGDVLCILVEPGNVVNVVP